MIIRRITETKDGNVEVSLVMSQEQCQYITGVGLATLVASGMAVIHDMSRSDFEKELAQVAEKDVTPPAPLETT